MSNDQTTIAYRSGFADGMTYKPELTDHFKSDEVSRRLAAEYERGYKEGTAREIADRLRKIEKE